MALKDYLLNTAKSFVTTQARLLYKEIRDNPQYLNEFAKGQIPSELGSKAKDNVMNYLKDELDSPEFANNAKDAISKGLGMLVERTVTEHKKETDQKVHQLLKEIVPNAIDAALLDYDTTSSIKKNKNKIIDNALKSVEIFFDSQQLLFSNDVALMLIKSELMKRMSKK
ncbi:MAG: hypothetical protein WEC35_06190 [Nitrosopumilaceae archaeon]